MLTGALAPDTGYVRLGTQSRIATLDSGARAWTPRRRAATLTGGSGDTVIHRRRAARRDELHEGLPVQA
jgi:hypothetical protein